MSRKSLLVLGFVLLAAVFTGLINLNSDEVLPPMVCLLTFSFVAGLLQPKGAWRWAVVIGLSICLSYFIGFAIRYRVIDPPHQPITLVVLVIPALIAAYGGAWFNSLLSSAKPS